MRPYPRLSGPLRKDGVELLLCWEAFADVFPSPGASKTKGGNYLGSVYGTDHGPFVSFSDFEAFLELLLRTGITVEIGRRGGGDGVPGRWVNTPLMTDFPTLPSFLPV